MGVSFSVFIPIIFFGLPVASEYLPAEQKASESPLEGGSRD